jgi:hypothetical protein
LDLGTVDHFAGASTCPGPLNLRSLRCLEIAMRAVRRERALAVLRRGHGSGEAGGSGRTVPEGVLRGVPSRSRQPAGQPTGRTFEAWTYLGEHLQEVRVHVIACVQGLRGGRDVCYSPPNVDSTGTGLAGFLS